MLFTCHMLICLRSHTARVGILVGSDPLLSYEFLVRMATSLSSFISSASLVSAVLTIITPKFKLLGNFLLEIFLGLKEKLVCEGSNRTRTVWEPLYQIHMEFCLIFTLHSTNVSQLKFSHLPQRDRNE